MNLKELADAVPAPADRRDFLELAQEYQGLSRSGLAGKELDAAIDKLMDRLEWGFRSARYNLPTREELWEMVEKAPIADLQV